MVAVSVTGAPSTEEVDELLNVTEDPLPTI
jgi:hypothetical protein